MGLVPHRCDGEMHLIRMRQRAGSDGIKPHRQLAEKTCQRIGRNPVRSEIDQRIHDLTAFDISPELLIGILRKKRIQLGRACDRGQLFQNRLGKRRDVEILTQRIGQKLFPNAFHFDLLGAFQLRGGEDVLDHVRAVRRLHGERVARFVNQSAACQRKLDMHGLLRGALAVEQHVVDHLGGERILFPELLCRGGRCGGRINRSGGCGSQRRDRGGKPSGVGILEIHIAIHAWSHTGRAQFFQTGIELLSDLAELFVGRVAERADGEFHPSELHVLLHESLVESHRRFGSIAIAPRGNDHQQVFGFRQIGGREIRHVFHHRLEAALFRFLHRAIRKLLGISALRSI